MPLPTVREALMFALLGAFMCPAFMLGYIVRGTVDEMGGELKLLCDWWKKRREKKNAVHVEEENS